jgi:hypothetical protein
MGKSKVLIDLKSDFVSTDIVANSIMDFALFALFVCHCLSVSVTDFM